MLTGPSRGGGEKIEHVAGIESDGDGIALVFLVDIFLGFAVFGAGSRNFDAFFRKRQVSRRASADPQVCENAAHGVGKFGALEHDAFVIVAGSTAS